MNQRLMLLIIICLNSLFLFACTNENQSGIHDKEKEIQADMIEPANIIPVEIQYVNRNYDFNNGRIIEEVEYYALGEHGEYFFVTGDDWTEEFMQEMIAVTEEGLKFAKNWLGYDSNSPISCVYGIMTHGIPQTNPKSVMQIGYVATAMPGRIFINIPKNQWPTGIIHEAVHAILRLQGRSSNFPIAPERSSLSSESVTHLEDGLGNLIEFLFSLETEHHYNIRFKSNEELITSNLHEWAIERSEFYNNFEDEAKFGLIYPQLMSYETAASFIYYLTEYKGTKEDFNRVFDDINLMEEIYSVSMDVMVAEWQDYLEQY